PAMQRRLESAGRTISDQASRLPVPQSSQIVPGNHAITRNSSVFLAHECTTGLLPALTAKYRAFSHVFARLRTTLQMEPTCRYLLTFYSSVGFWTEMTNRFPSWTSPVRIRSPALTYEKSAFQLHSQLHTP